ncbi:MAG: IS1182 family transposase [Steroidobacteraceae bacterium]
MFPDEPGAAPAQAPSCPFDPERDARLRRASRAQLSWGRVDLDAALPREHAARAIVAVVDRLDLRALYAGVRARGETAGAAAIDPKILLALWIYATSDGVGSGREIARLVELHAAYRWICGGVEVAYHRLNDFRSEHGEVFDALVTQVLARLMQHGLIDLHRVAQDGTRIRASAGAASFRRGETLARLMAEAKAHLAQVLAEAEDAAGAARRTAARQRAAEDRLARLEAALAELPAVEAVKKRSGAKDATARVSTTDPHARVMKMADGGFRPAYNVQLATTTDATRAIVGVAVTQRGTDQGEATPMLAQIEARTGVRPTEYLVDGGYNKHTAIDEAAALGVTMYAPLATPRPGETDPHQPKPDDSEAVAAWRARMATDEAKDIYKQRAATAETVNADAKAHRGFAATTLRGLTKVKAGSYLLALTYNVLRLIALGA